MTTLISVLAARQEVAVDPGTRLDATIDEMEDTSALQPGAALALSADPAGGTLPGAARTGAPRRSRVRTGI
jgi:hypothetical protein